MDIYRRVGHGLLASFYTAVLAHKFRKRGLQVAVEVPIPVEWEGVRLEVGLRVDLVVEGLVMVELKSEEAVARVHLKHLLTYLRLADKRVGLLINFGTELMKDGIHRVVNQFDEPHAKAQRAHRKQPDSAPSAPLREI